ncbi:MAG: hypothetical protein E4G95_07345, partial [Bacteroidia bacterium]
ILKGYSPSTGFIIEKLDPSVEYKADVRTVWSDGEINKRSESDTREFGMRFTINSLLPTELSLSDLSPVSGNMGPARQATLRGDKYPNSIVTMGGREVSYKIEGLFKIFSVTVGIDDNSFVPDGSEASLVFQVIGDGKLIYSGPALKKSGEPIKLNLDINGVNTLTLKTLSSGGAGYGRRGLMGDWIKPLLLK